MTLGARSFIFVAMVKETVNHSQRERNSIPKNDNAILLSSVKNTPSNISVNTYVCVSHEVIAR